MVFADIMMFLAHGQPWILALHIIAVMFWMGGMYYLPRLFVYHAQALEKARGEKAQDKQIQPAPYAAQIATFEVMEKKLLRLIINPSMLAAWFFGGLLLLMPNFIENAGLWLWVKLFCVLLLSAIHGFLARWRRGFLTGKPPHSSRFFRIVNELPPLLTIIIIIMVIIRPF